MKDHKLIQTVQTFSRAEMTSFVQFAQSPYFNKHGDTAKLINWIGTAYPRFDATTCDSRVIFAHLFPGDTFAAKRLAPLFTYAWRLCRAFLDIENRAAEQEIPIGLFRQLRRRGLMKLYRQEWKRLEPTQPEDFLSAYRIAAESDAFFDETQARLKDDSLLDKERNLDLLFMSEKLRDACEMRVRRGILKMVDRQRLVHPILREIRDEPDTFKPFPSIWMYYQVYQMMESGDRDTYRQAFADLENQAAHFPEDELRLLYNYFQNFCIGKINQGRDSWLREIFELYRSQLGRGFLLEDGHLSEWHYKNIVTTAIRLEELDWVKAFIDTYRAKLKPEVAENAYRFNLASYHYAAGHLGKVLDLLLHVEYSDLRYALGARALLLRTYYDLEEYEPLDFLYGSFRQFIRRKDLLADSRRQGYLNLFKLTHRAAHLRQQLGYISSRKARQELDRIKKAMAQEDAIFNRNWLSRKLIELEALVGKG